MVSSCFGIRTSLTLFISSTFSSTTISALIPTRRSLLTGITTGATAIKISHNPKTFASGSDSNPMKAQPNGDMDTGYLSSTSAYNLDQELMSQPGFSLEQLMELAGLSVAESAYDILSKSKSNRSILIVCGPGNNGGDGLVAARHLVHFGYSCTVIYPKRSKGDHFQNLVTQCQNVGIPVLNEIPENECSYDLIIDALFGFSFKGEPREPLATLLRQIILYQSKYNIPILSVDIPSGWHVEDGNVSNDERYQFQPDILISLTAPKLCAKTFQGRHFIGGRFLPDYLAEKYEIKMPPYKGVSQVYEVPLISKQNSNENLDWAAEYQKYLNEKEQTTLDDETTKTTNENAEDWAVEYQKYCEEKEKKLFEQDKTEREKLSKEKE